MSTPRIAGKTRFDLLLLFLLNCNLAPLNYCIWIFDFNLFSDSVFLCDDWQPLADAEGAKKLQMIELLKSHGGLSFVS